MNKYRTSTINSLQKILCLLFKSLKLDKHIRVKLNYILIFHCITSSFLYFHKKQGWSSLKDLNEKTYNLHEKRKEKSILLTGI